MFARFENYRLPEWALPYLINGDDSGLTDEEIQEVDQYIQSQLTRAGVNYFDVSLPEGSEPFFSHNNDIKNQGGTVYDCKVLVEILKPGDKIRLIRIKAKRWFANGDGNSYFNLKVWVNDIKVANLKKVYGYGDYYQDKAAKELEKTGFITLERHSNGSFTRLWRYCQENHIEFTDDTNDNY